MPTTNGLIRCTIENRMLTGTFFIIGKLYMFSGTFTSDVPTFASDAATITYDHIAQLESSQSFPGHFGAVTGIEVKLTNGVVIKGGVRYGNSGSQSPLGGTRSTVNRDGDHGCWGDCFTNCM